ncbi:MAG: DUF445 domain-containing protein [Rhodocyclaceae bacterium]|nr:DUF445 domain-containing protein [Rhodocyclaceae bacterium]
MSPVTSEALAAQRAGQSAGDKARQLARMRWFATGLLVAVTGLFILARAQHTTGAWGWIAAFSEAAMVGALADWFAVVALFRHPLGLPIPHTAIIPKNKHRVADNLAEFIRDNFLATETLVQKLRGINPAARIGTWLQRQENAGQLGEKLTNALAGALDFIADERVRTLLADAVRNRLQTIDMSRTAGQLLDTLTADNRHQELFDESLRKTALWLDGTDVQKTIARMIVEVAGKEYPLILKAIGFVADPAQFSQAIATAIVRGLNGWIHEIADDPKHPRRRDFDETVADFIARLKHDARLQEKIAGTKQELLSHPALAQYLGELWEHMKTWLHHDLAHPNSRLKQHITHAASALGDTLASNAALRASIDDHLESTVRALAGDLRDGISRHIAGTIRAWKDENLIRELELSVGKDLQFIRLNGTLVGGIIGLAIYGASLIL